MKNARNMKRNLIFLSIIFTFLLAGCNKDDDSIDEINLNEQQKAAVSLRGVWAIPEDVSMPVGTTANVLDNLVLTFKISDQYTPGEFKAEGADYFFATTPSSKWQWVDEGRNYVNLLDTQPTASISILQEGAKIRLVFLYTGGSGGKMAGIGEYGVTLTKVQP